MNRCNAIDQYKNMLLHSYHLELQKIKLILLLLDLSGKRKPPITFGEEVLDSKLRTSSTRRFVGLPTMHRAVIVTFISR